MSRDNWEHSPVVRRLIDASAGFSKAFPSLANLFIDSPADFRGFTMFLGDTNEVVAGLRRFGDDGALEILWSSGASPVECLINLDRAVASGKWREDKPKS